MGADRSERRREKVEALQAEQRRAERRRNAVISGAVAAAFVAVIAAVFALNAFQSRDEGGSAGSAGATADSRLVRSDSHRLSTAKDGKVTLVEFLDFECEACRAAYPVVEQLREEYGDRVTFVVRYFPIQSHFNAERAARAVEAAARQGKFEAMYQRMYETQAQWGEQQVPADATFRGFARDLGLDLTAWDATYNDPATLERIRKDAADGEALGVRGTPTFFLNGELLEPSSIEDFKGAIDAALAK
ncbi:DsbA family protein [Actinopolymorpha alba]|uniref:DsbA family protein n=1 Tax=Actinopolymorpha alba TaxID=533267 RepID=UPI000364FB88|nr:thioredoxin domain-containing protein [Actinopolymorpha alba]